jgi:hypothetical protein
MSRRYKRVALDGRSASGRRHRELLRELGAGLDHRQDEATRSLIRSTASLQLRMEAVQDKSDRGETIDAAALSQLTDTWRRNLRQLGQLQRGAQPSPAAAPCGKWSVGPDQYGDYDGAYPKEPPVGHPNWLARHLHRMRWLKRRCVAEPGLNPEIVRLVSGGGMGVQSALSPERFDALKAEYRKRELAGEFAAEVR